MSTAGQAIGGAIGAVVGFFVGGPSGALYGAQIGIGVGGYLDPPKGPRLEGPRLSDLSVQTSTYGAVIPRVYGTIALNGNVFWLENNAIKEVASTKNNKAGGKGGGAKSTTTTYSYYATFAVGLCEGPISGIRRIWAGSRLIYDAGSDDVETVMASNQAAPGMTIYTGSESQMPDTRMQATLGAANTPAYRGLAYIVFHDFALANYGNSLMGAPIKAEVMTQHATTLSVTTRSLPMVDSWGRLAATPDGVIALPGESLASGFAARSANGVAWTKTAFTSTRSRYGIAAADNGTVIALRSNEGVDVSVDHGATWTEYKNDSLQALGIPYSPYSYSAIAWNGSVFCVIASSGTVCATSPDGVSWTAGALPSSRNWMAVAWNGSVFCAVAAGGNVCATSPDGLSWTERTMSMSASWNDITWNGTIFCAVAYASTRIGAVSPDGITWTNVGNGLGGNLRAVAWNGEYFFVPNYGFGTAYISTDSTSWSTLTMPTGYWYDACAFNGVFIVVETGTSRALTVVVKKTGGGVPLAEIVASECLKSGLLLASDIDTSALSQTVRGYRIGTVASIRSALEPLQGAYPFDVVQSGYTVSFRPRGGAAVATIPAADLDARPAGKERGVALTLSREMDSQLPQRVTVQSLDSDREYATGEQYAERLNTAAVNIRTLEMPLALTADETAGIAETLLYLYWLERYDAQFALPPTYADLEPGDVVTVSADSGTHTVRLTGITYAADGRLECRAKYAASALYTPSGTGESGGAVSGTIVRAGPTVCELLDLPLLSEAYDTPGFVVALGGQSAGWPGAALYRSDDGGSTWSIPLDGTPPGAVIGVAANALAAHPGTQIDSASALAITLYSGDLESVSQLALFGGANYFAYGAADRWEVIAAQNCVQQVDESWLLTNLLRGRYGTEWASGLHAVGDRVVALDGAGVDFLAVPSSSIGLSRLYRAITVGRSIDSAASRSFAYRGVNFKPLSPTSLNGSRHPSSADWSLDWLRRTRVDGAWRDGVEVALGETTEAYDVEIWTAGYGTLKRTLSVTAPAATYTSAQQVADFGANQPTLTLRIYQLSAAVGRGTALSTTITR